MTVAVPTLLGFGADVTLARKSFVDNGFVAAQNAQTVAVAQALLREANCGIHDIKRAQRDDAQLRYSAGIGTLGPEACAFLNSAALADSLFALTGKRFVLTEDMSCLTVYEAGDQLGAHLDQPADRCAVTCILYLTCHSPDAAAADTGLQLKVYGRAQDSIKRPPRAVIRTKPGRLVLGRGAQIWHERPKLKSGEMVMALTACFGAL